jgi:hypothetical protein
VGGLANTAFNTYDAVGGGFGNGASGGSAFVGGGFANTASGAGAFVGGGTSNGATQQYATVGGGQSNNAQTTGSTVSGGFLNTATTGASATVGGGTGNTASNNSATVGGGNGNTASGSDATVPGGRGNTASAAFSSAIGLQALASNIGQSAQASGQFAVQGDAQTAVYVLRGKIPFNVFAAPLFLDGAGAEISIPPNTSYAFRVIVTARVPVTGNSAAYTLEGSIKNAGGLITVVSSATNTYTNGYNAGTVLVIAGVPNIMRILVNDGANSNPPVGWVARVETSEIIF